MASLLAIALAASAAILVPPHTYGDPTPVVDFQQIDWEGMPTSIYRKVAAAPQRDYCPRYKCLLVANASSFRVTGLYLAADPEPGREAVWEAVFTATERPIQPHTARWWYRNHARRDVCTITLRIQAVQPATGETIDNRDVYDFCKKDPIVVVRMADPIDGPKRGQVTVENDPAR